MRDSGAVRGLERRPYLDSDVYRLSQIDRSRGEAPAQRLAFDKFRGDEERVAVATDFVNGQDIRVIEPGSDSGLTLESLHTVGVAREFGGQEFERDFAAKLRVGGEIDFTHSTPAQQGE